MATHFSILAWEIPCTEEPGGLQSTVVQSQLSPYACSVWQFLSFLRLWIRVHVCPSLSVHSAMDTSVASTFWLL